LTPESARRRRSARLSRGAWVRRAIERELQTPSTARDPVERLSALGAPTADIEVILAEIESDRALEAIANSLDSRASTISSTSAPVTRPSRFATHNGDDARDLSVRIA
jgi:hypothetical protein